MKLVSIDEFITVLCSIPEEEFKVKTVFEFLQEHHVEKESLQPYLFFSEKFYTRNLVFKNNLFEVIALCWEPGQASRIHNHFDQNCWMTIPVGKLQIHDFKILESDLKTNFCRIEPTQAFTIDSDFPVAEVDQGDPVHQVSNLDEFGERAVSLHVYSKPFERCLVYTPAENSVREVNLFYTSIAGKLCDGIAL